MAEERFRKEGESQLSDAEIESLRARVAGESEQAVTVGALAEAAGSDRETVQEHLRRMRTERAFQDETTPSKSSDRSLRYWAIAGGVALLVAGGVAFQRLQNDPAAQLANNPGTSPAPVVQRDRNRLQASRLPFLLDQSIVKVPVGIEVLVVIPGQQLMNIRREGKVVPGPYKVQVDQVVQGIEDLVKHATEYTQGRPPQFAALKPPFMDLFENTFSLDRNEFHYGVKGWAGGVSEELKLPLGASERAKIREAVETMFEDERVAQAKALEAPSGQEIVSPPPGYRIQLAGRRIDQQEGPALRFAPISVPLVQRRIEIALEDAIKRDAEAPRGRWTENAERQEAIPPATRYVGNVQGPTGAISFDLPANPPLALKQGIRDLAARAAKQVATVNAQGASGTTD